METIKSTVVGRISEAVGKVIWGMWKGIPYVRARPAFVTNPQTEAQQKQRAKFALGVRLLKPCTSFIRIGYKNEAIGKTAWNAALSYILHHAITGYRIDYSRVLLSKGSLTPPAHVQAVVAGGTVRILWDDNSGVGSAQPTDRALTIAINPDKGEAVYNTAGTSRAGSMETLHVPAHWMGDQAEVYLGFISDDGKDVSDSAYAGSVTVS